MERAEAAKKIIDSLESKYWSGIHRKLNDENFSDYKGLGKDMLELSRELEPYFNTIRDDVISSSPSTLLMALNLCGDICSRDENEDIRKSIEGPMKIVTSQVDSLERGLRSLYDL